MQSFLKTRCSLISFSVICATIVVAIYLLSGTEFKPNPKSVFAGRDLFAVDIEISGNRETTSVNPFSTTEQAEIGTFEEAGNINSVSPSVLKTTGTVVEQIANGGRAHVQIDTVLKLGDIGIPAWLRERTGDFRFPSIVDSGSGLRMTIPKGDLPSRSARRFISRGAGQLVGLGDTITLQYEVYSWNTGKLVGSSLDYADSDFQLKLGANNVIPLSVEQALLGRESGSQLQVIVESGEFVPEAIDANDAYIYIVKIGRLI